MKKLAVAAVVCAAALWVVLYLQPFVVRLGITDLPLPLQKVDVENAGYTVQEASSSTAVYQKNDYKLVVESNEDGSIQSVYADTYVSTSSDMSVYGRITLGDSVEKVKKYYGEPTFDMGNDCLLFTKRFNEGKEDTIAIGTQDGKVIHIEIMYEDSEE